MNLWRTSDKQGRRLAGVYLFGAGVNLFLLFVGSTWWIVVPCAGVWVVCAVQMLRIGRRRADRRALIEHMERSRREWWQN